MATLLRQMKDVVQQFAEAFSAALRVDVEVFDEYQRIAGTGAARQYIGRPLLPNGIVKQRIFTDGLKRFIFDRPGQHETCRPCPEYGACHYKKAVHAAIEHEGRVIGIIGIFAASEAQAELIAFNNHAMLELVDRLAGLIAAKVQEHQLLIQMKTYNELMRTVNDTIDKGIIVLDKNGRVMDVNAYLVRKLRMREEAVVGRHIQTIFPSLVLCQPGAQMLHQEHQELMYNAGRQHIYLLCRLKPIVVNDELAGSICLLEDYADTTHLAYDITAKQNEITLADIVGNDRQFVRFKEKVQHVAAHDSTVLLTGETGTGKELFARAIHAESPRRRQPFIAINCGGIPESLLESELFGYEKGAFTGASNMGKHGKFFLAHKGTLFLDEVETLPLYLQPKLLRAIELKEIERIGGTRTIPVDVRIIAATNVRLDEMVRKGEFREDLFHRLNVVTLFIPPLRERGEDVLILADHFIKKFSQRFGKHIVALSPAVRARFLAYDWPGNVRELQNAIEYAINMEENNRITVENLPFQFKEQMPARSANSLASLERENIAKALAQCGWSEAGKLAAARQLGISRATLYRKIKKYQLRRA